MLAGLTKVTKVIFRSNIDQPIVVHVAVTRVDAMIDQSVRSKPGRRAIDQAVGLIAGSARDSNAGLDAPDLRIVAFAFIPIHPLKHVDGRGRAMMPRRR